MRKRFTILLIFIFVFGLAPVNFSKAADLANRLKGRILLQVESKGEAWYVNPDNSKRYYLGRPDDAFKVMRELGLGISNKDFDSFKGVAPKRLSGKILIKVEDSGEAYYVNPVNLKMHFLGKPADAFKVMREAGMGIKNNDLDKILENGQIDATNLKVLSNSEIIEKLKSSVVYIETSDGSGSGFIIESNGYILTNAHVVQGVSLAKVIFSDNSESSASVVGRDENIDLALLKIEKSNIKKATLGDSDLVKQGDEIFTLGYPFGIKGDVSFKEGTISRKLNSGDKTYLEISADIHPGNSGGPLVDKYGNVVGINSAGFGENINGIIVGETIKLAIPINIAKIIIPDLKNGKSVVVPKRQDDISVNSEEQAIIKRNYYINTIAKILHDVNNLDNSYNQEYARVTKILNSVIGREGKLNIIITDACKLHKNSLSDQKSQAKILLELVEKIQSITELSSVEDFLNDTKFSTSTLNSLTSSYQNLKSYFEKEKNQFDDTYTIYCAEMAKWGSQCDILY